MIVMIEGPRNVGKTTLMSSFLEKNKDSNVIYYKFLFAKYIDQFNMRDQESGPGMHYFSLGNILSIFELNQTLFKDKIILFDRCIHSAYVWAIYRERLGREKLLAEYSKILNSELYTDCSTFYINRRESIKIKTRGKDLFDNFESHDKELALFEELLDLNMKPASDANRGNHFVKFINDFNDESIRDFNYVLGDLIKRG
jgi:thymidylate kinase